MELERLYFFTATILNWYKLLDSDRYKGIVLRSFDYLVSSGKLKIYAFVIMSDHLHVIWELLELNGKEMPHVSFMKYTGHIIQKDLRKNDQTTLDLFKVNSETRVHQVWQGDSLSVPIYTPSVIFQKLDNIHNNPCRGKWMLSGSPVEYRFSSAKFYDSGVDDFGFLSHIGDRL